jgi:GGDEF domain-containing protein
VCRDASPAEAAELCRRICEILTVPVIVDGESVTIGASIGAVTAEDEVDAEALTHRADVLMYAAKQRRPREAPGVRTVAA